MKICKQIASERAISEHTVNDLCKKGKIHDAVTIGKSWQIPDDAEKLSDGRVSSGRYIKKNKKCNIQ